MEQEISLITQRKMLEGTRFNSPPIPRGIMRARLIKSFSENRGRRKLRAFQFRGLSAEASSLIEFHIPLRIADRELLLGDSSLNGN